MFPPLPRIPFELPDAEKYHIDMSAEHEPSTIAVGPALGHEGVQAVDQFYQTGEGVSSVPPLSVGELSTRTFYRPRFMHTAENRFGMAVVTWATDADQTLFGFYEDELPRGRELAVLRYQFGLTEHEARLRFVADRLAYFLEKKAGAAVELQFVD